MTLPQQMRAWQLEGYGADVDQALRRLRLVTKAVPQPGPGQVLVKVAASPCNPSDLLFMQGQYLVKPPLPHVPGWEGSGTVVAGGGLLGWWLQGKRVAFSATTEKGGAWAEYAVAEVKHCIPLMRELSDAAGAMLIVNPLTAVGLVDEAQRAAHRAIIQTAAASQLGRMVVQLARQAGLPLINIVRKPQQAALLRELGAAHVLDSSQDGFEEALRQLAGRLGATIAFEAVAGTMTGLIVNAMPPRSQVLVYGALSRQPIAGINPLSLIAEEKVLRGFLLNQWIKRRGAIAVLRAARRLQHLLVDGTLRSTVRCRVPLESFADAIRDYSADMTAGKVLLSP